MSDHFLPSDALVTHPLLTTTVMSRWVVGGGRGWWGEEVVGCEAPAGIKRNNKIILKSFSTWFKIVQ